MPEFSEEDLEISELPERETMIVVHWAVELGALGGFLGISAVLGGPDSNNHNESLVEPH